MKLIEVHINDGRFAFGNDFTVETFMN